MKFEGGDFVQIRIVDEYPHSYDAYMLFERLIEIQAVGIVVGLAGSRLDGSQLVEVQFPDPYGYIGDSDIPGVECFYFEPHEIEIADIARLWF